MRDKRFIAAHRGGPLSKENHYLLAAWAADCAERVLPLFEDHSTDNRPRHAVAVSRQWARGEIPVGQAQKASLAAHAAAREAKNPAAAAAARSAGHAVATAHFADHSLGAAIYALQAAEAAGKSLSDEYTWLIDKVPKSVRELVISAIGRQYPKIVARI